MTKFAIRKGFSSTETKTLAIYSALTQNISLHYFNKIQDIPKGFIPVGEVEWVADYLGIVPKTNHYPEFLKYLIHRKIWKCEELPKENVFVKPYDRLKRFTGDLLYNLKSPKPPFWCSEVVEFLNEWRYYYADGKLLYVGWYSGDNDDATPPLTNINVPSNWCGVVDIGITSSGEIELVEAGEPYAMGWYGGYDNAAIYVEFIIKGWDYLIN